MSVRCRHAVAIDGGKCEIATRCRCLCAACCATRDSLGLPHPHGGHKCHAVGCPDAIPPKLLMCPRHWSKVPKRMQAEVWKHYRPGQEIDKNPSLEYMRAMRAAVEAVEIKERAG